MNLERLSSELILDIFEYLQSIHLIRAFYQLNSRFNDLITMHFKYHVLDFQSISKHDFDIISQEYLPSIANHITTLRLSDDDDTPEEINIFLRNRLAFHRFTQLTSLTLYHISSIEILKKFINHFVHLQHLTHFYLIDCQVIFQRNILRKLINHLWRLPELKHCHLDLFTLNDYEFILPNVRSKSIKHLHIDGFLFDFTDLIRFFRCTPNLQNLKIKIAQIPDDKKFPYKIESLSSLKLNIYPLTSGTIDLLKNMPNLTSLTLETGNHHMNGHRWEEFITNYLPKLKVFQFRMLFVVDKEEDLNKMIDSYRTPFWLIHHQWFVRCHFDTMNRHHSALFYTLPYAFPLYTYDVLESNSVTKSTCPNEDDYLYYNSVTKLVHPGRSSNDKLLSNLRFDNIRQMEVSIPYSDVLLSLLSRLDRLISLDIRNDATNDCDLALLQLNNLINKASHLYSLTISYWDSLPIQEVLLHVTSNSIRRLNLLSGHYLQRGHCFNRQQCAAFLRTPWAKQCEVLEIVISDQSLMVDLIDNMINLRALKVMVPLHQPDNHRISLEERIQWMTTGFSRTFTENLVGIETKRCWIRHQTN